MLVLNLACPVGHAFEGWFGSSDDFESQQQRGLVSCPSCGMTGVERRPTAPRLNVAHPRGEAEAPAELPAAMKQQMQQALRELARQVIARTEDVGERFADEARRIHYGEAEERGIRGQATPADAAALADEGIAVMALPPEPTLQ
ncbi:DUF1178 family protein [Pelomonas sp. KK5]|uniref:DUF1178 family protein n=1 Tax=Pelomonas sp. KK5 TaxID=1855730 RepID=UPI00097C6AF1|nr:DUF1178 family protein [Pelomonas sp. KK5]